MIEEDIVPRLLKSHQAKESADAPQVTVNEDDVAEVVRLATYESPALVSAHLQTMIARGVSDEDLMLNLMAPAARQMGDLWTEDRVDFLEVTFGLANLQHALREISPVFDEHLPVLGAGPRILLASAPAEQHTFGLLIIEEFFRRAGWNVTVCVTDSNNEIVDTAGRENFAIIGFSLSCDHLIDTLIPTIDALNKMHDQDGPKILAGGRSFAENPEFFSASGADAIVTNGRDSVPLARRLIQESPEETGLVDVGT